MNVRHLAGRFTRALYPGPARPEDLAWVASILTPAADEMFRRQPNHDQRHAIAVARDVQRRLAGTPDADDPRWLAAALLHDIGKLDAHLGIAARVVVTLAVGIFGRDRVERWSDAGDGAWRARVGRYLRHADIGADHIRAAGGPEVAAQWAAGHHDPSTWPDLGIPAPVIAALDAADND